MAAEGKAIAKVNDLVIFVPYVVPGDVVDLQIKRKKHHYAEAVAVKFHEYSRERAVPFCQHYGVCGGCKWQVLPYSEQIKYKQKQVTDNLTRIGKIELPEISPILGSEKTQFYRNKLEYTFSNKRWLTEEEIKQNVVYEQMNAVGFHSLLFLLVLDLLRIGKNLPFATATYAIMLAKWDSSFTRIFVELHCYSFSIMMLFSLNLQVYYISGNDIRYENNQIINLCDGFSFGSHIRYCHFLQ